MSLENFFSMPKKRNVRKKRSVIDANTKLTSHDNMASSACEGNADREQNTMQKQEDAVDDSWQDNLLAQQVTENITKILDVKLELVIKPVTEKSEEFNIIMERLGTVEQRCPTWKS